MAQKPKNTWHYAELRKIKTLLNRSYDYNLRYSLSIANMYLSKTKYDLSVSEYKQLNKLIENTIKLKTSINNKIQKYAR